MHGKTKLLELTIEEYEKLGKKLIQDVSVNHFLKAADDLYWKNTRQLGVEITGKDITKIKDVHCIRKTFDHSQDKRIQNEKIKDVLLTDGVKRFSNFFFTLLALGLAAWVAATK